MQSDKEKEVREIRKWKEWKKKEEQLLCELGVSQKAILALRAMDLKAFADDTRRVRHGE